jgi:hypothetical protein
MKYALTHKGHQAAGWNVHEVQLEKVGVAAAVMPSAAVQAVVVVAAAAAAAEAISSCPALRVVVEAEVSLVAAIATVVVIANTVVETCVRVVDLETSQQATSQVANELVAGSVA